MLKIGLVDDGNVLLNCRAIVRVVSRCWVWSSPTGTCVALILELTPIKHRTCIGGYRQLEELDRWIIPIVLLQRHHHYFQAVVLILSIALVLISSFISKLYAMKYFPLSHSIQKTHRCQGPENPFQFRMFRDLILISLPLTVERYRALLKNNTSLHVDPHCI